MPSRNIVTVFFLRLMLLVYCLTPLSYAGALPNIIDGRPLPSLAPMLERITPSVVNIATQGTQPIDDSLLKDPFFKRFLDKRTNNNQPIDGTGSGVIIHSRLGHILTNYHVIENAQQITVTLNDGRRFEAGVVGIDPRADLAILNINADNLVAIRFGDSDALRVGDFVVAIGNPYGIGQSVTSGIISALHRNPGIGEYENFIQTDASINLGNSGGALVNLRGELVGVNTAILGGQSGGNIGIGFAIPVNTAAGVIDQIVRFGAVKRGELGIEVRDVDPQMVQELQLAPQQGALVTQIFTPSAAEQSGITVGDVILRIDGHDIYGASNVKNLIGSMRLGSKINITYLRNNTQYIASITLTAGSAP